MTQRTIASLGALCLLAGGAVVVTAAPARADAASCIEHLTQNGAQTVLRNQVCELTEAVGDILSPEAALLVCQAGMTLTLLPQPLAQESCARAVAP
jgi:hypothetical protein